MGDTGSWAPHLRACATLRRPVEARSPRSNAALCSLGGQPLPLGADAAHPASTAATTASTSRSLSRAARAAPAPPSRDMPSPPNPCALGVGGWAGRGGARDHFAPTPLVGLPRGRVGLWGRARAHPQERGAGVRRGCGAPAAQTAYGVRRGCGARAAQTAYGQTSGCRGGGSGGCQKEGAAAPSAQEQLKRGAPGFTRGGGGGRVLGEVGGGWATAEGGGGVGLHPSTMLARARVRCISHPVAAAAPLYFLAGSGAAEPVVGRPTYTLYCRVREGGSGVGVRRGVGGGNVQAGTPHTHKHPRRHAPRRRSSIGGRSACRS